MMSPDTRERAAAKAASHPASMAAKLFGVSERETGTADGSTGARRDRPPKVSSEGEARLCEAVAARSSRPAGCGPTRRDPSPSTSRRCL